MSGRSIALRTLLASLSLMAGCASIQSVGSVTPRPPTAAVPRDYGSACAPCHDRGGYGVRVLADRVGAAQSLLHTGSRLPPDAIRVVVRRGLGAMPAMSRAEVSDSELQSIIDFLSRVGETGGAQ